MGRWGTRITIAAQLLAASAGLAGAGGFAVREQSAEGQGASFAGVAAGLDGLSAMFWNGATMTLHEGYTSESNFAGLLPSSRADDGSSPIIPLPGFEDSGNIGVAALLTSSYSVYQVNDRLFVGLAMNSPFGLSTDAGRWAGSPLASKSSLVSFNANPNVAYKLSDVVSVSGGVQVEYAKLDLEAENPVSGLKAGNIEGDDVAFGFTAGVLFTPSEATQAGLGFRSAIAHSFKGDGFLPGYEGGMKTDLDMPEIVTLGIRHRVNDQWTALAGVEWSNWSRVDKITVEGTGGVPLTTTLADWNDGWFFSLGAEYAWSDDLTLRAGVAYEISPVPDSTRGPALPDNDRYWVSAGLSHQLLDWVRVNFAYTHIFFEDGEVDLPGLSATFKQSADSVAVSATLDW